MKYVKELSNRNKIVSETTCEAISEQKNAAYTIKFVFSGTEECEIHKRKLSIYPDSFAVLNAGTTYSSKIDSITPVNTFSISFEEKFLQDFQQSISGSTAQLLDHETTEQTPGFIESLYPFNGNMRYNITHLKNQLDRGLDDEMLINEYLHHCLLNYHSIYNKEVLQKMERLSFIKSKTKQEVLKRLTLAKEYINSNYNQNILLENIADHACLSVNHLLRTFKEAYEISPYQYLIQLRLARAKKLLQNTAYPLHEIVGLVGFECPSSFIRLFKSTFNITPAKYKRMKMA
jgi:AraC-like DNA-binding protein